MTKPILLILGPTAGGKSRLALDLATSFQLDGGGEIVSADSMQIYRGMDIGTAKPTKDELEMVPHHLVDQIEPTEDGFTVSVWVDRANQAIQSIRQRKRWPIVVGGTNLYIKALVEGLIDGPPPDASLRQTLLNRDPTELRLELERVDPAAAERIHPNDLRRTIRAVEVYRTTGQPLSSKQEQWDRGATRKDLIIIGLEFSSEEINRRINARVREMMDRGLAEEVRRIAAAGFGRQAREALGYAQLLEWVEGRCSLEEAVEQIKIKSRRYAKQQRTWLRRFRLWPRSRWILCDDTDPTRIRDLALKAVLEMTDETTGIGQG